MARQVVLGLAGISACLVLGVWLVFFTGGCGLQETLERQTSPGGIDGVDPLFYDSEVSEPVAVRGFSFWQPGGTARLLLKAKSGTPFGGGASATIEWPVTIIDQFRAEGRSVPCGLSQDTKATVEHLTLPDGTKLPPYETQIELDIAAPRCTGTDPEVVTPRVAEALRVFGTGFGPDEGWVTMRFTARLGTPFDDGTSATFETQGQVQSEDNLFNQGIAAPVGEVVETDLSLIFPSGVVVAGPPVTFAPGVRIQAPGPPSADDFGVSVYVGGDTAIVGAPDAGAAYLFVSNRGRWSDEQTLTGPTPGVEGFGASVARAGGVILVGTLGGDVACAFEEGVSGWTQVSTLTPPSPGGGFGSPVAMTVDTALVAAPVGEAVHVYVRAGSGWNRVDTLTASDGTVGDRFGHAVAIDAQTIVVGAPYDDDAGTNSGSLYVFEYVAGTWTQVKKLVASDGTASDELGSSVAVSGGTIIAGAPGAAPPLGTTGSAYIFAKSGGTWSEVGRLNPLSLSGDQVFGSAVAIQADTVVVGAPSRSTQDGATVVYRRAGSTWTELPLLFPWQAGSAQAFGAAVALDGSKVIVGVPTNDPAGFACIF